MNDVGVSQKITGQLQVFVNRCLRNILNIYSPNMIPNENLLTKPK